MEQLHAKNHHDKMLELQFKWGTGTIPVSMEVIMGIAEKYDKVEDQSSCQNLSRKKDELRFHSADFRQTRQASRPSYAKGT